MTNQFTNSRLLVFLISSLLSIHAGAQNTTQDPPTSKESAIITAMKNSENDWNNGDLDSFMKMYTGTSTMMMPTGPVGLNAIRDLYQNHYFNGKMPKQQLNAPAATPS